MKKIIRASVRGLLAIIAMTFILWTVLSFCQVLLHNMDALHKGVAYTYPNYNFFVWVANLVK